VVELGGEVVVAVVVEVVGADEIVVGGVVGQICVSPT